MPIGFVKFEERAALVRTEPCFDLALVKLGSVASETLAEKLFYRLASRHCFLFYAGSWESRPATECR